MADTGWKSPGTVVSDSSVGTEAWTNPDNAKLSDNVYASIRTSPAGTSYEQAIKIVKSDGSIGATNKAAGAALPTTEQYVLRGGPSDLWGETWSASDINDTDFGVVFQIRYEPAFDFFTYSNYLKATNFGFSIPAGATISGIEVRIEERQYNSGLKSQYAEVDHIQIKVYYTESSGTEADSERGLYIAGYSTSTSERGLYLVGDDSCSSERSLYLTGSSSSNSERSLYLIGSLTSDSARGLYIEGSLTSNSTKGLYITGCSTSTSERGLYLQGYLAGNSTRGLYIEGFVDTLYSRESSASLKADDSNLSTMFSEQDYTDVATDDDTFVDLEGTSQYFQFLFKEPNGNENDTDDFKITWKGKSTLAPSSSAVYLQIYNRTAESWTTLVSNSSANANTEFTLEDKVRTNLSDYYDENYIISVRVYQDGVV